MAVEFAQFEKDIPALAAWLLGRGYNAMDGLALALALSFATMKVASNNSEVLRDSYQALLQGQEALMLEGAFKMSELRRESTDAQR